MLGTAEGGAEDGGRDVCPVRTRVLEATEVTPARILASATHPGFFTLMTPRLLRLPVSSWSHPEQGGGGVAPILQLTSEGQVSKGPDFAPRSSPVTLR